MEGGQGLFFRGNVEGGWEEVRLSYLEHTPYATYVDHKWGELPEHNAPGLFC
jgi:hypothetical protein